MLRYMTPCSLADGYQRFKEALFVILKKEAAGYSTRPRGVLSLNRLSSRVWRRVVW
jgi:hypothetical protein